MSILTAHMSRTRIVVGVDTAVQFGPEESTRHASKLFALPAAGCVIGGVGSLDVTLACFAQALTLSFEEIADSFCDITGKAWAQAADGAANSPHARLQPIPAMTYLAGWDPRCGAMRAFWCVVSWDGRVDFDEVTAQAFFTPSPGVDVVPLSGIGDPVDLVRQTARLQVQHASQSAQGFRFGGRLMVADLCAPDAGLPWLSISDLGPLGAGLPIATNPNN